MKHYRGTTPRSNKLAFIVAFAVALLASLAAAGPASADEGSHRTWQVQVGSESRDQEIQGMAFLPSEIFINKRDTITWHANSAEIHTVTFLASGQSLQPFNPFSNDELLKRGGDSYDGHSYYNSGLLANVDVPGFPDARSYSLSFPREGDFTYYCLVHGMVMKGTVHVRDRGTDYPYSQADYDKASRAQERSILRDGQQLDASLAQQASNHKVIAGGDDGVAMVMRFVRPTVTVHVGDTVVFANTGMDAPHTVTFGTEPANIFAPSGDRSHFNGGDLNSGIMWPGDEFAVTFQAKGTFEYICALHDYMGMVGKVRVVD
ncbi:plastocyanin [Arthrobacter sp. SLBN-112]|jgi:plastocyanin|uniref:plastocyanin/azurin family copper-binding protein n=1 Tax=Arthrobacter sp. SLBN-112 TaxID=2768452 RepID=UPI001154DD53|nr:plastocyanin/azurin family copper-binding protein [Arthrobacter sp. SLBN-112]TQJ40124.1 plastocyanin [Arthrobacter sp. SLBN-112]